MNQNNQINDNYKNELFNYNKENYDKDSPEKTINFITKNNNKDNLKLELFNENKEDINEEEEKNSKNEEFIIFPNIKEDEENKINRFSNLNDNELPLEDKIQIQKQFDNDNTNESEQIEVIENILNNFEKEKYKNKYLKYKKRKKNKFKSLSVTNPKNNILNKIKHDIVIINFEQEINNICQNKNNKYNYNLIFKGDKLNINKINNNYFNKRKNNNLRIEQIRKKLFSGNNIISKTNSISNHQRNEKRFFNHINNENYFFNSCNNFYNTMEKDKNKINNDFFNNINNIKEIKINNFNFNRIYNNFYDTFRKKRIDVDNENNIIMPFNTIKKSNKNHYKIYESPIKNSFNNNSNQFFYNVFNDSIKEYPYLHLLTKKVNKMKYDDFNKYILNKKINGDENNIECIESKGNKDNKDNKDNNKDNKDDNKDNKDNNKDNKDNKDNNKDNNNKDTLSILEKFNRQKEIFLKEIDKYNKKNK